MKECIERILGDILDMSDIAFRNYVTKHKEDFTAIAKRFDIGFESGADVAYDNLSDILDLL